MHTIAVDIDGVLADFPTGFTKILEQMGLITEEEIITQSTATDWLLPYDRSIVQAGWDYVNQSEWEFWANLPCLLTSDDKVRMWDMFELYNITPIYLTARHDEGTTAAETAAWIVENSLPPGPVFVGVSDKAGFMKHNQTQVLAVIDDRPGLLDEYWKSGFYTVAMAYVYNEHAPSHYRAESMEDFANHVIERANQPN